MRKCLDEAAIAEMEKTLKELKDSTLGDNPAKHITICGGQLEALLMIQIFLVKENTKLYSRWDQAKKALVKLANVASEQMGCLFVYGLEVPGCQKTPNRCAGTPGKYKFCLLKYALRPEVSGTPADQDTV